jgi:hypothetical protein
MLDETRRTLRRMQSASPFFGTGMHPNGDGGIDSDNFVAGSSGYSFKADGNAEFNDITIRGAAIGIDAPVLIQTVRASASNFALTLTLTEKAGVDVTVPEGCTRLRSIALGRMYIVNPNTTGGADGTGTSAIYVQAGVGGSVSVATPTGISGSNGFATTNGDDSFELDGLTPGQVVRVNVLGACAYASIAASTDNYASVVASLTWLR